MTRGDWGKNPNIDVRDVIPDWNGAPKEAQRHTKRGQWLTVGDCSLIYFYDLNRGWLQYHNQLNGRDDWINASIKPSEVKQ